MMRLNAGPRSSKIEPPVFEERQVEKSNHEIPEESSQVWVAICASSSEGSTRTEQRDVGLLMGSSKDRFRVVSRLIPSHERPPQIAARTFASCSPIPPVKTSRSTPSRAAIMAATCLRIE